MNKLILSEINQPMDGTLLVFGHALHSSLNQVKLTKKGFSPAEVRVVRYRVKAVLNAIADVCKSEAGSARTKELCNVQIRFGQLLDSMSKPSRICWGGHETAVPALYCMAASLNFQTDLFLIMSDKYGDVNPAAFCGELIATWRFLPNFVYLVNEFQPEVEIPLAEADTEQAETGSKH